MSAAPVVECEAEADWLSAVRRDLRDLPVWVNDYIGIPWRDKGRERDGYDCWGIVRAVYAERLGLDLPSFAHCYDGRLDFERIVALMASVVTGWERVHDPEIGDAVWMWTRRPSVPHHVAIYVGGGQALTAFKSGSMLIDLRESRYAKRVAGIYRPRTGAQLAEIRPDPTPPDQVRIIFPTSVLSHERVVELVAPGPTVEELLNAIAPQIEGEGQATVTVGGVEVPPAWWPRIRPKAGTDVRVEYVAEVETIIAFIILASQAIAAAGTAAAGAVGLGGVAGAIGAGAVAGATGLGIGITGAAIIGNLALGLSGLALAGGVVVGVGAGVQALFKTSTPSAPKQGKDASPTLQGVGNAVRPFEPIPVVFGRHRVFPAFAAPPYTFVRGGKQWVRALVALQGRYRVTDLKIGDIAIESISGARWQIREGGRVKTYEAEIQTGRANGSAVHRFYRMVPDGSGDIFDTLDPAVVAHVQGGGYSTVAGLVFGDANQAVQLTSANAIIPTAGFTLPTDPSDKWTVTLLCQPDAATVAAGQAVLLMVGDHEANNGFEVALHNGKFFIDAGGGGKDTRIVAEAGKAYHLAVEFDGADTYSLYVNGQLAREKGVANAAPENFWSVGGRWKRSNGTLQHPAPGVYDDLQFWAPNLSPSDTAGLHDMTVAGAVTRGGFLSIFSDTWSESQVNHSLPAAAFDEPDEGEWRVQDVPGDAVRGSLTINHLGVKRIENDQGHGREYEYWLEIQMRDLALGADPPWQDVTALGSLSGVEGPVTIQPGYLRVHGTRQDPFLRQYDWDFPHESAQWQVRVRRTDPLEASKRKDGSGTSAVIADAVWNSLRGGERAAPINLEGLATVAIEAPVDEVGGALQQINLIAESVVPIYDASGTVTGEAVSRNPADHVLWALLEHPAEYETLNPWPERPDDWNFAEFADLRSFAAANGFNHDEVADTFENPFLLANRILTVCRANLDSHQGKWRPVIDRVQASRVGFVTPKNSSGFTLTRTFPPRVHAWRARFLDETAGWRENERIVYEDGHDASTANKFREIDLTKTGITHPDHVFKHVRVEMAKSKLLRETMTTQMGPEFLLYKRGVRLGYSHPVAVVGRTAGRITQIFLDGETSFQTGVLLDAEMVYEDGVEFGIDIILVDGTRIHLDLVNPAAGSGATHRSNRYDFTVGLNPGLVALELGLLSVAGVRTLEAGDAVLRAIVPNGDTTATLHLIPYKPAIFNADTQPIPSFDTQVTLPAPITIATPPRAMIESVISDEKALALNESGVLVPRIILDYTTELARARIAVKRVEAQWRVTPGALDPEGQVLGGSEWEDLPAGPAGGGRFVVSPVEQGVSYDLRLKTVGENDRHSLWSYRHGHVVVGQSSPPPPPENLRLEQRTRLVWSLTNRPLDFLGFRVRMQIGSRTDWGSATPLDEGVIYEERFALPVLGGGERTFLVKSVDRSGNESEAAAILTTTLTDPDAANAVITNDQRALGFPGTKTDCTVVGGDLVADAVTNDFWAGSDTEPFWGDDDGALYWQGSFTAMAYEFTVSHAALDPPGELFLNVTAQGGSFTVEYDRGVVGVFVPFLGRVAIASGESVRFRISIEAGSVQGKITQLVAVVDVPDVVQELEAQTIGAVGTIRLPLTKTFRKITAVLWSAQQAVDNLPRVIEVIDKGTGGPPLTLGPSVVCKQANAANTRLSGVFDIQVIGY